MILFTISRREFDGVIFDLDGVLTDTAGIHAAAWKTVFNSFLHARAQQQDVPFRPFDIEADYLNYVDGRPRDDGIRNFLASRGLSLPQGSEHDPEDGDTVHSLGERKTWLFRQALQKGIAPTAGADALLQKLRKAGIKTAVGSSSKNTAAILHAAGLEGQFDICIDGLKAEALKLPGSRQCLEIARRLDIQPSRAVLEDAFAGSSPANEAASNASSASITASNVTHYVNTVPMSLSKACDRCT